MKLYRRSSYCIVAYLSVLYRHSSYFIVANFIEPAQKVIPGARLRSAKGAIPVVRPGSAHRVIPVVRLGLRKG